MNLWEHKTEISPDCVNAADDVLLELGVEGWSVLEDVIVKQAWIVGIFDGETVAKEAWRTLLPLLGAASVVLKGEPELRELGDRDWKDSYKAHFKASHFGRLHWVPEWERGVFELPEGHVVLWLDPGLAFGTGNHETTRLCCERLVTFADSVSANPGARLESLRVIDAGCGSGILSLSASLLGFENVEGFDNDPEAVRVSGENAALNRLSGKVRFSAADLVSGLAGRQADFVMANIQADVLQRFSKELLGAVAPGGTLVLSGILAIERDRVRDAFASQAPAWKVDSRVLGEWSDVVLVRP